MNRLDAVETLRHEHAEIAHFLASLEGALNLMASVRDEDRSAGIARLREMASQGAQLRECCRHDAEALNSSLFLVADDAEWTCWRGSLFRIERASYEFRKELGFATTLSTEAVVAQGDRLIASFRKHLSYEEELLHRIENSPAPHASLLGLKE